MRLQRDPYDLDEVADEVSQTGQVRPQLPAVAGGAQSHRQVPVARDHVTQLLDRLRHGSTSRGHVTIGYWRGDGAE